MLKIKSLFLLAFFSLSSFTVFTQTENWRLYRSAMAGFAVKYPASWKLEKQEAKGQIWGLIVTSPGQRDDDVWEHNSIGICSKPKSEAFENLALCRDSNLAIMNGEIVSEKTIVANGLKIRRFEKKARGFEGTIFLNAVFSTQDRDYLVRGAFRKIFNLDRFVPVFDELLKTFQILKEKPVATYKNAPYDFALTYPVSWKSCEEISKNISAGEETLLILAPESRGCSAGNYIQVTRMTKFSQEKNNRELKGFLNEKDFDKVVPYVEFGNIHAALGERVNENHIFRERYFYTNYPQTYELLKITESYEARNEILQQEAGEILTTARRFLRFQ